MSEKWTNRIAVFCMIGIIGIVVAAVLPDRQQRTSLQDVSSKETVTSEPMSQIEVPEEVQAEQVQAESAAGMSQGNLYYYNALSDDERKVYLEIYDSVTSGQDMDLSTIDDSVVDKVFQCMLNDHPEIFYCAAYQIEKQMRNSEVIRIRFKPNYHMTEEEIQENNQKIADYVQKCIADAPGTLGQYEKVKYVYEYIIQNTEYVANSENNQNICSVFIGGKSVCQGYAKATQYILSQMGIEITLAYGNVKGELHSWNLVRVDGEYYYMDPTWGDAGYVRPGNVAVDMEGAGPVNYEYFLITSQQLLRSHTIDNIVPLPACVSTRNNYYVREGLYFTTYDQTMLKLIFEQAEMNGKNCVTFMCADMMLYETMKEKLIVEQEVFKYIKWSGAVSYSYNDGLYTLIFWIE